MVSIFFFTIYDKLMPIQLRESGKHGQVFKKRIYLLKSYTKLSVCSDIKEHADFYSIKHHIVNTSQDINNH